MTHWRNASHTTGASSRRRSLAEIFSTSAGVVAGTIRSTIVQGKATSASIQPVSASSRSAAKARARSRSVVPLLGKLSQDRTVVGGAPACRRASSPATSAPIALRATWMLEVLPNVGMLGLEAAGCRVVAIAIFGHGQRH
jgi:hypothetical protein